MIFHVFKAKNVLFYSKVFFSSKSRFSLKSYFLCDFFRSFSLSINNWMVISQSLSSVFLFLFANDHKRLEESKKERRKKKEKRKERKKRQMLTKLTLFIIDHFDWIINDERTNENEMDQQHIWLMEAGTAMMTKPHIHSLSLTRRSVMRSGVNFTNILHAAFTRADPRSAKRQSTQAAFCAFGICEQ